MRVYKDYACERERGGRERGVGKERDDAFSGVSVTLTLKLITRFNDKFTSVKTL